MASPTLSAEKQGDVPGAAPSRGDSPGDPRDLAKYAMSEHGRSAGKEHDVAASAHRPSPALGVSVMDNGWATRSSREARWRLCRNAMRSHCRNEQFGTMGFGRPLAADAGTQRAPCDCPSATIGSRLRTRFGTPWRWRPWRPPQGVRPVSHSVKATGRKCWSARAAAWRWTASSGPAAIATGDG